MLFFIYLVALYLISEIEYLVPSFSAFHKKVTKAFKAIKCPLSTALASPIGFDMECSLSYFLDNI